VTSLREVRVDDVDALMPCFDRYRAFYGQDPAPDAARAYLTERLKAGDCRCVAAFDKAEGQETGTVVGFTLAYPTFSSVRMRRQWVLNDLYVNEDRRGTGLAEAVVETLFALARAEGIEQVDLMTQADNTPARRFYGRTGWRDTGFVEYSYALD